MTDTRYMWNTFITIALFIMGAVAMPNAIKHDHYIAIMIWIVVFLGFIW